MNKTKDIKLRNSLKFQVYLAGNLDLRWVKIGYTKNLPSRLVNIQTNVPFPLQHIASWGVASRQDAVELEYQAHKRVADKRIRGEWFNLTIEEVVELAEYLSGRIA